MPDKQLDPFTNIPIDGIPEQSNEVNGSTLLSDVREINSGDGQLGFRYDSSGIWFGAKTFALAPFSVSVAGAVTATSITITGGTLKYGKTGFTDSTNRGYYLGNDGFYFGDAADATKLKFDIATGGLDYVGSFDNGILTTAILTGAISALGHFIDDRLNTSTKEILGDFTFGVSGALKMITDANNGLWISPTGLLGKKLGVTTFSIDTSGNATFAGTLSGASGTFGTITSGSLTGVVITGSTINITTGALNFYDGVTKRMTVDTLSTSAYFSLLNDAGGSENTLYITAANYALGAIEDSYSETNQSGQAETSSEYTAIGQSFTADTTTKIFQCKFYLKKDNLPTGTAVAKLYAHTGTYGTDGKPTGGVLATSDPYTVSDLTTSFQLITFTFTGVNRYEMSAGTYYCIVVDYTAGDNSNHLCFGSDLSAPSHDGNLLEYSNVSGWNGNGSYDLCFYVYGTVETNPAVYSTKGANIGASGSPWKKGYIQELTLSASTTIRHPLNIGRGANPTTPIDGDLWYLSNSGVMFYDGAANHNLAMSDGGTGGTDSAGAGKQYVELEINGTVYKVLHDGTV